MCSTRILCGRDKFSGRSYEHRRSLIESELLRLTEIFFLDVVAYAVMSNHYHVVLYIDQSAQKSAGTKEIVTQWHQLHQGNLISTKFLDGETLEPYELDSLNLLVDKWREKQRKGSSLAVQHQQKLFFAHVALQDLTHMFLLSGNYAHKIIFKSH